MISVDTENSLGILMIALLVFNCIMYYNFF